MPSSARPDRDARLRAMFVAELVDRTRTMEEGLLALEGLEPAERGPVLDELARAAHTLKGTAAMMGAPGISTICHELEDDLDQLRTSGPVSGQLLTRLLGEIDRIRTAGAELLPGPDAGADDTRSPAVRDGAARRQEPRRRDRDPVTSEPIESIRVPLDRLEMLVRRSAQLRNAATSLAEVTDRLTLAGTGATDVRDPRGDSAQLRSTAATLGERIDREIRPLARGIDRASSALDVAIRDAATVPIDQACTGLRRSVRDIAEAQGKEVRLELSVGDARIDRRAIDVVRDALVHLVRNAADHGIEPVAERTASGKPDHGTIAVTATARGDSVVVEVRDDGRGIDTAAVAAAAASAGVAADTDPHEAVFTAGLSTAAVTTDISGRGVGLDAVRERVESLRGSVTLDSSPGAGTVVTLTVPISVAAARVLIVQVSGEQVALAVDSIDRLVRIGTDVVVADERTWIRHEDDLLPLMSLAALAGIEDQGTAPQADAQRSPYAVIVPGSAGTATALLVDHVVGEQELLVQPVDRMLPDLAGVIGAGVLTNGQAVLLLHPAALVRAGSDRNDHAALQHTTQPGTARSRVLLAEDAPTTRALEQGLLEAAGYEVITAVDGQHAWELLQAEPVDVVVTDVEMPRLDGLALCERIRRSPVLRELPIVLVTSRGDEADRRRGADAGADAYLVKSAFAQGELAATIARLTT